jgi:chromate transport protein ChrA
MDIRRTFWLCFTFVFIFFVIGVISFLGLVDKSNSGNLIFLFGIWFLGMFLLLLFAYYAILRNPHCYWMIYTLLIITLLFATIWAITFTTNKQLANISIALTIVFALALIYLSPPHFHILGILYILSWLFIFFYLIK